MTYFTYILRCSDDSLYTGITTDFERREKEHITGGNRCAKYTKAHGASRIEAVWQSGSRSSASRLEFYIKKMRKAQKERLIFENDLSVLGDKIDTEIYKRIYIDKTGEMNDEN